MRTFLVNEGWAIFFGNKFKSFKIVLKKIIAISLALAFFSMVNPSYGFTENSGPQAEYNIDQKMKESAKSVAEFKSSQEQSQSLVNQKSDLDTAISANEVSQPEQSSLLPQTQADMSPSYVQLLWERRFQNRDSLGGLGRAYGVAVDQRGHSFVAGSDITHGIGGQILVREYDENGSLVREFASDPTAGSDDAFEVAVDPQGNVIVSGSTSGGSGGYLVKFNSQGQKLWEVNASGIGVNQFSAIAIDSQGKIYAAGYSAGGSGGQWAIMAYNADGSGAWQNPQFYDSSNHPAELARKETAWGIAVYGNSVYVVGEDLGGDGQSAVVELDAGTGARKQVYQVNPTGGWDTLWGIAVDNNGDLYVGGHGNGTGVYVEKLRKNSQSQNLERVWSYQNNDRSGPTTAAGIAFDPRGFVVVSGMAQDGAVAMVEMISSDYGDRIWHYAPDPSSGQDEAFRVAVDKDGYVHIVGYDNQGWWIQKLDVERGELQVEETRDAQGNINARTLTRADPSGRLLRKTLQRQDQGSWVEHTNTYRYGDTGIVLRTDWKSYRYSGIINRDRFTIWERWSGHTTYSNQSQLIETYSQNQYATGQPATTFTTQYDSQSRPHWTSVISYDNSGRMTRQVNQQIDGQHNQWIETITTYPGGEDNRSNWTVETYEGLSLGNTSTLLVKQRGYDRRLVSESLFERLTETLDISSGRVIHSTKSKIINSFFPPIEVITTDYNEAGNITGRTTLSRPREQTSYDSWTEKIETFETNGRYSWAETSFGYGRVYEDRSSVTARARGYLLTDGAGQTTEEFRENLNTAGTQVLNNKLVHYSNGQAVDVKELTFNNQGNITQEKYQRRDANSWVERIKNVTALRSDWTEFRYGGVFGQDRTSILERYRGFTTFGPAGRIAINVTENLYSNNQVVWRFETTYRYDAAGSYSGYNLISSRFSESGNLLERRERNFDRNGNEILSPAPAPSTASAQAKTSKNIKPNKSKAKKK